MTAISIALAQMTPLGAANAALSSCGPFGNCYAGSYSTTQNFIRGARATIEPDNPDLCPGTSTNPSDSSAWVMVAAQKRANAAVTMCAQAGYAKVGASPAGLHKFTQHTKSCCPDCGSGTDWVTWYGTAPTTDLTYVVKLEGDGELHMYAGGVDVAQTNYKVLDFWSAGWNSQFAGEAFHPGTDIPGTSADKVSFWNLQYYQYGGTYNYVSVLDDLEGGRRFVEQYRPDPGGTGINIWTYPIQE